MLTVVGYADSRNGESRWWCRCECGGISRPFRRMLVTFTVKSCGCLNKKKRLEAVLKYGSTAEKSPEYGCWHSMKQRCFNKNSGAYNNYGGRGITVCDKWRNDYSAFLADVGRRPSKKHTLDRYPNNDGNYEPGNVRWATYLEQAANRRPKKKTSLQWQPMKLAPKDGTLVLYMGVDVVAASCYWNKISRIWCDPDRPGKKIFPNWWATMPYGYTTSEGDGH